MEKTWTGRWDTRSRTRPEKWSKTLEVFEDQVKNVWALIRERKMLSPWGHVLAMSAFQARSIRRYLIISAVRPSAFLPTTPTGLNRKRKTQI